MWIDLVCGGAIGIMVVATAFMIARLEMIRKTPQPKTTQAKWLALAGAIFWLLIFFVFNDGWRGGDFFDSMGIITFLLLVIPYVTFLRLWLCLRLDKVGRTITPNIVDLQKWDVAGGTDQWYAKYEYLGEYRGKRKVYPTEQILQADYAHLDEFAEEDDGAVAIGLPNASVVYLEKHPNIHRFEYQEAAVQVNRQKLQIGLHEKGFLRHNWKTVILVVAASFLAVVILIGAQMWFNRNDLIVKAEDGWTRAGLTLKQGQCVQLQPFGTVQISEMEGYNDAIDAAGWEVLCAPNDAGKCMMDDAPYGALIARFGQGEPFVLDKRMKVSGTGPLWLAVNDNLENFADNRGYFRVKVKVLDQSCD
ncbi:MAG: hypothetical protein V2J07_04275 [Anaerolineae bacterium]|jgi:hypothetical protein|nr:hypothetical protein [Anaerolineae bacterium]